MQFNELTPCCLVFIQMEYLLHFAKKNYIVWQLHNVATLHGAS